MRPATASKDAPNSDAARAYAELVRRVYNMKPPFDDIRLSDEAMITRERLEARHLELMGDNVHTAGLSNT